MVLGIIAALVVPRIWLPLSHYDVSDDLQLDTEPLSRAAHDSVGAYQEPYIFEVQSDSGAVLFFGSRHTQNPDDPQLETLKKQWQQFSPTMLLVESNLGFFIQGIADPVKNYAEMGYAYTLARKEDLPTYTLEPEQNAVVQKALETFDKERVALFYVLRPYFGQRSQGKIENPEAVVEDAREDRTDWPGLEGALPSVAAIDSVWKRDFPEGPDWRDVAYRYGLPGYLDDIHHVVNRARDEHFLRVIMDLVRKDHRVFVVAGSSHAVKLEDALRTAHELATRCTGERRQQSICRFLIRQR